MGERFVCVAVKPVAPVLDVDWVTGQAHLDERHLVRSAADAAACAVGAAIAAGVLSGTYAFGKSSITTLIDAHEKGIEFRIVTSGVLQDAKAPYAVFLVNKDSPLRGPLDIIDQKVGVSSIGDIGSIALSKWVLDAGGDFHRIAFVEVPLYESGPALAQHRVEAAEAGYPSLVSALATGQFRVLPAYAAIAPQYLLTAWFTTADYAAKNPDVVRRFARGFKEAAAFTNTHHVETAPLMAKFTGIEPDVFRTMFRAPSPPDLRLSLIQPIIDAMAAEGRIKRSFPARDIVVQI